MSKKRNRTKVRAPGSSSRPSAVVEKPKWHEQLTGIEALRLEQPSRAVDGLIALASELRGTALPEEVLDCLAAAVYAARGLDADGPVGFNDLGRRKLQQADRKYVSAVLV